MKLSFYGAAREVTGSCYHLNVKGKNLLVDCGMQQGQDEKEIHNFPFSAQDLDAVILTHAHIDHSGKLPLLTKNGFQGPIYATGATCDLITIMLRDSAHIQEMDAQWDNRKGKRAGKDLAVPLYSMEDVEETLRLLVPCTYNNDITLEEDIVFRFTDAGHLLGSASIQMWLTEDDVTKKIVFSGDIGNVKQPIIRDPQYIKQSDYVVMESTYGDRNHEHIGDYVGDLAEIFDKTLGRGGNVIIPSFAVGRTQELLYFIREIKEKQLVKSIPDFQVVVDSPLASEATRIYDRDLKGYADEDTIQVIRNGFRPTEFSNLFITETTEDSKALNEDSIPKVIISSSGMCEAGRIRHHLKHNLWRPECTIIFVGFQANGTLGRMILDGADKIKLFNEEIVVRAQIVNFRGLSAHADKDGLLKWVHSYFPKPKKVFVVHGEASVCDAFTETLVQERYRATAPNYKMVYDLLNDVVVSEGVRVEALRAPAEKVKLVSFAYGRLLEAGEKLLKVIKHNEGGANRDLIRFAEQIQALADKWDR